jgi:hypothetical protein
MASKAKGEQVEVRTPNQPGYAHRVDKAKYEAMKQVLLRVLPPGKAVTQAEMLAATAKAAPQAVFPGSTSAWWTKCVQLDLEARGELERIPGKPLRWKRA